MMMMMVSIIMVFTIKCLKLPEKSVMFTILSSCFSFLSFLVVFVQILEFFPAFLSSSLVPMFFRKYPTTLFNPQNFNNNN